MRPDLRDPRLLLLALALSLSIGALIAPTPRMMRKSFDALIIVDITGSMNTRDYTKADRPISRLQYAKETLGDFVAGLPCGSRIGLGVFSERRPFLLFEPLEVCENFAPLTGTIEALDWRMAWEGDSRIAAGLFRAIDMARELKTDLVFITDGQEAPPLPFSGPPPFEGRSGEVRGLIAGAGGYELAPIPKFNDDGREIGFYSVEDVPHDNRFGLPPPGDDQREGYNARNAPFGGAVAVGVEHLSSVREVPSPISRGKDRAVLRASRRVVGAAPGIRAGGVTEISSGRPRSPSHARRGRSRGAHRDFHPRSRARAARGHSGGALLTRQNSTKGRQK